MYYISFNTQIKFKTPPKFFGVTPLNVRIPILIKSRFELFKLIPIPIIRDHNSFILNFEPKQLVKIETVIAEIPIFTVAQ